MQLLRRLERAAEKEDCSAPAMGRSLGTIPEGWEKSRTVGVTLFDNREVESTDGPILHSATDILGI